MEMRFTYIKDPKNPQRVITIARSLDKTTNTVTYGWAVCAPDRLDPWGMFRPGDTFTKEWGRKVSTGRYNNTPRTVQAPSKRPLEAILTAMQHDETIPSRVRKYITRAVAHHNNHVPLRSNNKAPKSAPARMDSL